MDAVENLVLLLRQMGHDVEFSVNVKEAVATARSYAPEFVLLDLSQSTGNGYETARRLRHEPGLESTRVFALRHLVKPEDAASLEKLFAGD